MKKVFASIKAILPTSHYKVLELHCCSHQVVLQIRGRTRVKLSIEEVVTDISLLHRLTALEACWLGIYYGRFFRRGRLSARDKRDMLCLESSPAECRLISEGRGGYVTYTDSLSEETLTEHPRDIVQHPFLINKFSAGDACYIGMLAGIHYEKQESRKKNGALPTKGKPALKLVF